MTTQAQGFTGRHMWLAIGSFFAVVIAVNVGMAVVASTSWTGLVVQNSYVAGQDFEDKRLAHEAQQAAGWRATFSYAPGIARLVVVDGADRPLDLGPVTLKINRPVGGHDDRIVTLDRAPDGTYEANFTLAAGVWEALVQAADTSEGPFELHQRFSVGGAE